MCYTALGGATTEETMQEAKTSSEAIEARLAALCRLGQQLILLRDEHQIAEAVLDIAREVLDFEDSDFFLADEDQRELCPIARRGDRHPEVKSPLLLDGDKGITVAAARSRDPIYVPDVRKDPRYLDVGFPALSELVIPVQMEGRLLGVINVESRELDAFTEADQQLLTTLASQAALALENARLFARAGRHAAQLKTAAAVAEHAGGTLELETLLQEAAELIRERLELYYVGIFLVEENQEGAVLRAGTGEVGRRMVEAGQRLAVDDSSTVGWSIAHGEARIAPAAGEDALRLDSHLLPETRSEMALPLVTRGRIIGAMTIQSTEIAAFSREDITVLQTMADQLANAVENTRLYRETLLRAGRLAIVNRIARAVTATLDLDDLAETVYQEVNSNFEVGAFFLALYDEESGEVNFRLKIDEGKREPKDRHGAEGLTRWVVTEKKPLLIRNLEEEQDRLPQPWQRWGTMKVPASWVGVPMLIGSRVVGVLSVQAYRRCAYGEEEQLLLSTIADQVAVAIENARLYEQEHRRVEELVAINKVGRRISATLDFQETLDAIVEAAAELVPCSLAEISLWDEERQMMTLRAIRTGPERAYPIGRSYPAGKGYTGWVVRHKQSLLVRDVDARQDIRPDLLPGELPFKCYLGVPLLLRGELIGTVVLIHERAGAFGTGQLRLIEALAAQATAAVRNARLYEELARRNRELAALNAVAAAINRATDLETLLASALDQVIQVIGADGGGIRLLEPATGHLPLAFSQGLSAQYVATVSEMHIGEGIAGRVAQTGEPALIADLRGDPRVLPHVLTALQEERLRSFATVPLRSKEETVGTLGVTSRAANAFKPADLDLLTAIGHQVGVAIENAKLRQQALAADRLAAVGRVAGTVAHDLRSPLGGIARSAEFLARPELSDATRQKLSRAVVAMARRLLSATQEILEYTRGGRMSLNLMPCVLPAFVDEVLEVLRVDFSDRGIEVVERWGYDGTVRMDPDRMAQVVHNIAANARDVMPDGGRLTVTTRRVGDWVELCLTDTGPGVPPELATRIFEPFFSAGKRDGAGLGLAIARRIVQEHRGEIYVESSAGGGATFVVRLPLDQPAPATDRQTAGPTPAA
jgi:GAF domain-containing protein